MSQVPFIRVLLDAAELDFEVLADKMVACSLESLHNLWLLAFSDMRYEGHMLGHMFNTEIRTRCHCPSHAVGVFARIHSFYITYWLREIDSGNSY